MCKLIGKECWNSPHFLRKITVMMAMEHGGSVEYMKLAVGHKSVGATQKYVSRENKRRERMKMESTLRTGRVDLASYGVQSHFSNESTGNELLADLKNQVECLRNGLFFVFCYLLFVFCFSLFVICFLFFVICYLLFVICYLLFVICYLLFVLVRFEGK